MISYIKRVFSRKKTYVSTISRVILKNGFSAIVIMNRKGKVVEWNPQAERLFGWPEEEAIGEPVTRLIIPKRYHSKHSLGVKSFFKNGNNTVINSGEVLLTARHKEGYEFKVAVKVNHVVTKGKDVFVALISDRSMEQKIEEERKLYTSELNGRIKTIMTIVQSITKQSLSNTNPEEVGSLLSRIFTIDKAINVLSQNNWKTANLYNLIYDVTYIYGAHHQFNIIGDKSFELTGNDAISFALVVHELCANSIKYGALREDYKGNININWHVADNSLIWHWEESEGPDVVVPKDIGFGMQFIKRAFTGQGAAIIEYPETGLSCTIVLKLDRVAENQEV